MAHRLQNKIAGSRYALPITLIYGAGIWLLSGLFQRQLWPQFTLMLITTLVMVELNNQHALMRTYSRMLSCSFLVLSVSVLSLFMEVENSIVQLCFALTYLYLFRAYQDKTAISSVFSAFFFMSVASIWFIQVLFFVPVWWIALRFYIVGMGWRTFWASLLGLITPYWFVGAYHTYRHTLADLIHHFSSITHFATPFDYQHMTDIDIITFCLISLLGIIGMIHFIFNSSKDKIRIRLLFSTFILMMVSTILFILLQPAYYDVLLPLLIVSVSPLIGHYITFTGSRISGIICLSLSVLTLSVTAYQIWMLL